MTLRSRLTDFFFSGEIRERIALAVRAIDLDTDRHLSTGETWRDDAKREHILQQSFDAWRLNPLARRIVEITSDFVVGGGIEVKVKHRATHDFVQEFWKHPFNRMDLRMFEWCDELTRAADLFVVLSTDAAGMSYVRVYPAQDVTEIETAKNDIEQEKFITVNSLSGDAPLIVPVYDVFTDRRSTRGGKFKTVCFHFAVNRPVGALFGEPDLSPLLKWLSRYSAWLEDRVRLNSFRNVFMWIITGRFANEAERKMREQQLNSATPRAGSIIALNDGEVIEAKHPQLDSYEAGQDGLAIKRMVSVGVGLPMHFLSEPESSTRTTAEQAGGPTFRHFDRRQRYFLWMIEQLLGAVVRRRAMVDSKVKAGVPITAVGQDISAKDNSALAVSASTIIASFQNLRDKGLIPDAELLRMSYKFAGEIVDVEQLLAEGRKEAQAAALAQAEHVLKQAQMMQELQPAQPQPHAAPSNGNGNSIKKIALNDDKTDIKNVDS